MDDVNKIRSVSMSGRGSMISASGLKLSQVAFNKDDLVADPLTIKALDAFEVVYNDPASSMALKLNEPSF